MISRARRPGRLGLLAAFAISLLLIPVVAFAQADTWTPTGNMNVARRDHNAVLLANGKVLIAAGLTPGWEGPGAELYDPLSGTFTPTAGALLHGHSQGSTATLLADGRVLIVGGLSSQSEAEIYDPSTDTFTAAASLNDHRCYHSATRLADGRVLIAGGQRQDPPIYAPVSIASSEVYDPGTDTFTIVGPLSNTRTGHEANLLEDGRVLVTGGGRTTTAGSGVALDSAEIFAPTTSTFTPLTATMSSTRVGHSATLLRSGRVLIAGGIIGASLAAEVFDPATESFTTVGQLNYGRSSHTATLLPDGRVLLAGGFVAIGPVTTATAEIYDPASAQFTMAGDMGATRQQFTSTLLPSGLVLAAGGYGGVDYLATAELYQPAYVPEGVVEIIEGELPPLPGGSAGALKNQLALAEKSLAGARIYLAAGNAKKAQLDYCHAIRKVREFISVVESWMPFPIEPAAGELLIADANNMIWMIQLEMSEAGLTPCSAG